LLVTASANGVFEVFNKDFISIFNASGVGRVWENLPNIPVFVWLDDIRLAILGPIGPGAIVHCWQFDDTHATLPFLKLVAHEDAINDIQYDKQTEFIATASEDQTVRLWKTDKSSPYHDFKNHTAPVKAIAFQPQFEDSSPRVLASASFDGTVSLYDVTNLTVLYTIGNAIHSFPGDRISCVSWSPDGKYLTSGDLEGVVGVWEWQDSSAPRAFAIWAPDRVQEDQQESVPNGMNGHKDELDRPVYRIHWQKNGQSFVVCRENRKVFISRHVKMTNG